MGTLYDNGRRARSPGGLRGAGLSGREFLVVWAGRHRRANWEELCTDYRQRIARYVPIRDLPVKARAKNDDRERRRAETTALFDALPDPCRAVVLDPRGRTMSSEDLAARLGRLRDEWPHPVAFLVGSDLGLDDSLLQKAYLRLSFSPMIFGHELARLVLYEQLYRALCIERGIKYHRQTF